MSTDTKLQSLKRQADAGDRDAWYRLERESVRAGRGCEFGFHNYDSKPTVYVQADRGLRAFVSCQSCGRAQIIPYIHKQLPGWTVTDLVFIDDITERARRIGRELAQRREEAVVEALIGGHVTFQTRDFDVSVSPEFESAEALLNYRETFAATA